MSLTYRLFKVDPSVSLSLSTVFSEVPVGCELRFWISYLDIDLKYYDLVCCTLDIL